MGIPQNRRFVYPCGVFTKHQRERLFMQKYVSFLRENPDFARIWMAQVVSLLGD